MSLEKPLVCIGLATFQRLNMLESALKSVAELSLPTNYKLKLIVCDNDVEKSAFSVFEKNKSQIKFDSQYIVESNLGIVSVRNRILLESANLEATYLAFFDDDETLSKDWIVELLSCLVKFNADAVLGKVKYLSESGENISFLKHKARRSGDLLQSAATNNILFSLKFYYSKGLKFHEAFQNSGGSDTFHFRQFHQFGGKIVYCAEAISYELVVEDRNNQKWINGRAFRDAYNSHLMDVILYGRLAGYVISLFRVLRLNFRFFILSKSRKKKNRSKARGIMRALSNKPYFAYEKIYGH